MSKEEQEKLELERNKAELIRDKNKWRIRRRLALTSFSITLAICVYYLMSPFFLTPEQAAVLRDFNSIVLTLVGTFISVVLAYIGAVTYTDNHTNVKLN